MDCMTMYYTTIFTISHTMKVRIYHFRWRLLMLKVDILFNLSIKDCMFITSTTENPDGCLDWILIGLTHGLKEAWLLVLASHHHSPPLALQSNLNPSGFLDPHANSTMLYLASRISSHANCTYSLVDIFHFQDSRRNWDLPIHLLLLLFSISHIIHGKINTLVCK